MKKKQNFGYNALSKGKIDDLWRGWKGSVATLEILPLTVRKRNKATDNSTGDP
ncbi:hypothetical protein WN55_04887 [Dufourea novaeangliae]|uniref:Uncharacterized protein n=1 Tax=Dufourea novaeangliae TaxID=178035 RepID=A0A154PP95_DUFNO|nr:hypothetical protein WN55_04887 [Dufourea novaeangliae]